MPASKMLSNSAIFGKSPSAVCGVGAVASIKERHYGNRGSANQGLQVRGVLDGCNESMFWLR